MRWFTSRVKRFWNWTRRFPKKKSIPVLVIILIAISFGSFYFSRFYSYMQNDPDSCHIMEKSWDRWVTSEHRDVGCHSCHEQSLFASAGLLLSFAFGDYERVEKHAVVPDDACEKCHESDNLRWI